MGKLFRQGWNATRGIARRVEQRDRPSAARPAKDFDRTQLALQQLFDAV